MKKYIIIFGLFFLQNCFSQKYEFDTYSCFYNDNQNINWNQIILTNNSNKNVKVILNQKDDYYIGAIQEYTRDSLIYHFIEVKIDSINDFNFQVKYSSSIKGKLKRNRKCFDENNFYDITKKVVTPDNYEILVSRFERSNLISKVTLECKKIDFNFLNHFSLGYFATQFMDCQELNTDNNVLVKKATFSGDINYTLTLIDYKHINIKINIEKPIYRNQKK